MSLISNTVNLHLGLKQTIRILQITDVHLSLADDIDGEDLKKHAASRRMTFFNEGGYPERDPVGYFHAYAPRAPTSLQRQPSGSGSTPSPQGGRRG